MSEQRVDDSVDKFDFARQPCERHPKEKVQAHAACITLAVRNESTLPTLVSE